MAKFVQFTRLHTCTPKVIDVEKVEEVYPISGVEGGNAFAVFLKDDKNNPVLLFDHSEILAGIRAKATAVSPVQFADSFRAAIHKAKEVAKSFQHEYISTEHALLGLLQVPEGRDLLANHEGIEQETMSLMTRGPDMVTMGKLPQTPRLKKVIEFAIEKSAGQPVEVKHLLLGLCSEEEGVAGAVLKKLGVAQLN